MHKDDNIEFIHNSDLIFNINNSNRNPTTAGDGHYSVYLYYKKRSETWKDCDVPTC